MKFTSVFRTALPKSGQSLNSQTFATKQNNMSAQHTLKQRLRPLVLFIRIMVVVLLTWSAGNGFLFVSAALQEFTDSQWYAVAGGLAFAVLFEAGKYFFGAFTLRALIRCWWREGFLYRFALILLIPISVAWFAGSYWLSTQGGMEGLRLQFTKPAPEIRKETLPAQSNADLETLRMARDSVYQQALLRSAPRTATRLFMAFQSEISRMETRHAEAQQQEKVEAAQRGQELKTRLETVLNWLSYLGGWSELLTLLLLVFLEMYTYKVKSPAPDVAPEPVADEMDRTTLNYLRQRARQCWRRAHDSRSNEITRKNNRKRAEAFFKQLSQHGIRVEIETSHDLSFTYKKHPQREGNKPGSADAQSGQKLLPKRQRSRKPQLNNHVY